MRCQSGSWGFDSTQSTITAPVCFLVMVNSCRRQAGGFTSHLTHCGGNKQKHSQLVQAGIWVSLVIYRVKGLQNWERQIKREENREREWSNNHVPPKGCSATLGQYVCFWKCLRCVSYAFKCSDRLTWSDNFMAGVWLSLDSWKD